MTVIKKILIADDHSIVARGLNYLISLNFSDCKVTQVPSLQGLSQRLASEDFTHLILDLNLDDGSSLDMLPEIIEKYPDLHILIYSMASEEIFGKKLLPFNISGFLSKKSEEGEIIQALRVFFDGGIYISKNLRKIRSQLSDKETENNLFQNLSLNELKVLELLLKGHKTKGIASEFNVAQQTIATYKSRIFKKLGTENIFEIQKLAELYNIKFS